MDKSESKPLAASGDVARVMKFVDSGKRSAVLANLAAGCYVRGDGDLEADIAWLAAHEPTSE